MIAETQRQSHHRGAWLECTSREHGKVKDMTATITIRCWNSYDCISVDTDEREIHEIENDTKISNFFT